MTVQHRNSYYSHGQALAELIIACAILAILLFGVVSTINFSVNAVAVSTNKTRATYYAQDGLEQARAARNTNWTTFSTTPFLNGENNSAIAGTIYRRTIAITNEVVPGGIEARRVTSTVTWYDGTQQFSTQLIVVLTNS